MIILNLASGEKMLRLLPELPESSNNNDNFELEKLKKELKIQMFELGVDTDYLSQNFVLFDVKKYNDSDIKEEDVIYQAINFLTKGRTTVVIAHRLSTILNSEKIFVIDKGEVVDNGNHDELIKSSKIYKNFYEKQIKKH